MISRRRVLPALVLSALLALVAALVTPAPAVASSTILCKSFAPCKKAGMPHYKYKANYLKMWWRMYAGHNCTNYVAYRMIQNGMSTARPWSGSGDARNWGVALKSKVNQTPTVGSVAWWSSNHVAYVEQVIDANTIVISEDHWKGDFDWRRIVRAGGGWPTGFIHLADEALKATVAPAIPRTPQVDVPITAGAGTWNKPSPTLTYQWSVNGAAIPGATSSTFTPTAAMVGKTLTVTVRAAKSGYAGGVATSAPSAPIVPGTLAPEDAPSVTGLAKVGSVLTAGAAGWRPAATATSVQWQADGVAIPGATDWTYTVPPAQLGRTIRAVVTGTRTGYRPATQASAPTAAVLPELMSVAREPGLTGAGQVGQALKVAAGATAPAAGEVRYQWRRDGQPIKGAKKASYTPTADDLGHVLAVRVRYLRPGYTPVVRTLELAQRTRGKGWVRVGSKAKRTVTVEVRSSAGNRPAGKVVLTDAAGHRKVRTLKKGTATFRAKWLKSGRREVTVEYLGSAKVTAVKRTRSVVVR